MSLLSHQSEVIKTEFWRREQLPLQDQKRTNELYRSISRFSRLELVKLHGSINSWLFHNEGFIFLAQGGVTFASAPAHKYSDAFARNNERYFAATWYKFRNSSYETNNQIFTIAEILRNSASIVMLVSDTEPSSALTLANTVQYNWTRNEFKMGIGLASLNQQIREFLYLEGRNVNEPVGNGESQRDGTRKYGTVGFSKKLG